MLDKFAEQNAVMRERYADEFIMPEALETAYKTFVKACIDYRVSKPKNGKGETSDFIYSLSEKEEELRKKEIEYKLF